MIIRWSDWSFNFFSALSYYVALSPHYYSILVQVFIRNGLVCFCWDRYYSEELSASLFKKKNTEPMHFACTNLWSVNMDTKKADCTKITNNIVKYRNVMLNLNSVMLSCWHKSLLLGGLFLFKLLDCTHFFETVIVALFNSMWGDGNFIYTT